MRFFPKIKKDVLSWAMHDWANSAFATTVMAGFFPIFFKKYWSSGASATESTFYLGTTNSIASLVVVVLAPALGAIADSGNHRKRYLFVFASLGIVLTGGLYFIDQGHWEIAALAYAFATVGYLGANIFYDSLIKLLSEDEHEIDRISALGYALGYLGGGLLFAVNVFMTLKPEFFGLADATTAVRLSFVMVAVWWAVFSIPLFLNVREPESTQGARTLAEYIRAGLGDLRDTFYQVKQLKQTFLFLLGFWLYIDGVHTIIRMAVDYGMSIGFSSNDLIVALLITQFVGFPSAIVFGRIGNRFGPKLGIIIGITIYSLVTFWAHVMQEAWEFYVLAIVIGLVQGGVQALSRSLYARLIPSNKAGQFYGFYNMMGKFAAVVGPIMVGWVALITGDPRLSILSVNILFIIGGLILVKVDVKAGQAAVKQLYG